jgi:hypothetical protein
MMSFMALMVLFARCCSRYTAFKIIFWISSLCVFVGLIVACTIYSTAAYNVLESPKFSCNTDNIDIYEDANQFNKTQNRLNFNQDFTNVLNTYMCSIDCPCDFTARANISLISDEALANANRTRVEGDGKDSNGNKKMFFTNLT